MQETKDFMVITNHERLLEKFINRFNKIYHTDFILNDFFYDEVKRAIIGFEQASPNQVFDFGYHYGSYMRFLVNRGYVLHP